MRRLLLLQIPKGPRDEPGLSLPEYVDKYLKSAGFGGARDATRFGDMVRGFAEKAGMKPRVLQAYTDDDFAKVSARVIDTLAEVEVEPEAVRRAAKWPDWPNGWRDAARSLEGAGS